MVALGGVALAASSGFIPVPFYVAGGLALVVAGWLALRRGAIADSLGAARLELLPALITSIVEDKPPEKPAEKPVDKPARSDTGPFRVPAIMPVGKPLVESLRGGACPLCGHKRSRASTGRTCGFTS